MQRSADDPKDYGSTDPDFYRCFDCGKEEADCICPGGPKAVEDEEPALTTAQEIGEAR